jgi:hypothetical protein
LQSLILTNFKALFCIANYVSICESKELFINARKYFAFLRPLEIITLTLDSLASKFGLPRPSVSRRAGLLKSTYLVETAVVDRK